MPNPTYQYGPYAEGSPPANPSGGSGEGVKYRIYNIFKPTITLDELSLQQPPSDNKSQRIENTASLQYPLVKINNYIISADELEYVDIDCTDFLPRITVSATFANELFIAKELPKDGDIISIAIRNKSDVLAMIRNDYVITGVTLRRMSTSNRGLISMTFFGELFVPGLKSYLGSASYNGTSMEVLKEAANQLELGFNTNEAETEDQQIWYVDDTPLEFIENVTSRAWKDENSFFDSWVDIYYNLNFINVQKQLISSEDEIDIGALINNVDSDSYWGSDAEANDTVETPKVFSNFMAYRTTSFYITDWKPNNQSSAITFKYGTSMTSSFFEHINALYEDPDSQKYWSVNISPAYDDAKLDSYILLRGRATYDPEVNEGETARANYNYTELYTQSPWMGIQYTINNPNDPNTEWSGNMHRNFHRARVQNCINNAELEKLNIEVNVQGTNLNVIKGDKIPTVLIRKDPVEVQLIHKDTGAEAAVDFFYSGWYYVKGFTLSWTRKDTGVFSNFRQSFVLTRREWPPPEPIDPIALPEGN